MALTHTLPNNVHIVTHLEPLEEHERDHMTQLRH
jgi:hypothetical protein